MLEVLNKKKLNQSQSKVDAWDLKSQKRSLADLFEHKNTLNNQKKFKEQTKQKWDGMLL